MSKAFTKENDSEDLEDIPEPLMPSGVKNYITPQGFSKLQQELQRLKYEERPKVTAIVSWAAGNGDRSENGDYIYGKKRLREIDSRIRFLTKRIEAAEQVAPGQVKSDQIFFGATVTYQDEDGEEKTYSIVGVDEADISKKKISWVSPLTLSLLKARVGDVVTVRTPKGPKEVEIIRIEYKEIEE
ncbi:MAG: transcription elongation factor GreB [Deltaproteobacteria bacterium]|nr:transcription elongation factor GreB [Deltaproteobacteria bacterium]